MDLATSLPLEIENVRAGSRRYSVAARSACPLVKGIPAVTAVIRQRVVVVTYVLISLKNFIQN